MANPRKFSEKIALHNQKQAEETAAFEAIIRDVTAATRGSFHTQKQHLHLQQHIQPQYRGGSLPNVNQMVSASNSNGVDLQTAFQQLEGMRAMPQGRVDRGHPRDRGRQQIGPLRSRPFTMEKSRADCSPYGSASYLSPPPDTSWRRTNSDSAIHTSTMGGSGADILGPNTPPIHRRIHEVVGENSGMTQEMLNKLYPWDPKKLQQQRPRSCEVPNINICPSGEQDGQIHMPVSNNTGSLPDLTILQFPSPLTTPIDVEDQTYASPGNSANLSPTSAHHMNMGPQAHPTGSPAQSPGSQRRRPTQGGPSPLVLTGNGNMRMPHSPPVSNIDPSTLQLDPRIRQQYMLYMHQQQQRHRGSVGGPVHSPPVQTSPTHSAVLNNHILGHPRGVTPPHRGTVPKVCVTSHENDSEEPSMTQYRNNSTETGCQSPTSPHSQPSYSPSQSPGLSPHSWNNKVFEMDPYQVQQQQQTNALQHQFEQFNMVGIVRRQQQTNALQHQFEQCIALQDNQQSQQGSTVDTTSSNSTISSPMTSAAGSLSYSQANMQCLNNDEFAQQAQQAFYSQGDMLSMLQQQNNTNNSKIPDIVLSGADDTSNKVDFAKELGNAITGMADGCFDADFFSSVSDEALKDNLQLGHLDLESIQMLTDPTMVTDADTENSFRLDQMS